MGMKEQVHHLVQAHAAMLRKGRTMNLPCIDGDAVGAADGVADGDRAFVLGGV
jgi:hypothetical protein